MSEEKNPISEPLQKSAQAANAVRGAVKTGKAIAGAVKGAAAGGPYGAAAGFVWENRKWIGKIILAVLAVMMIPILFICMLPSLIFGGLKSAFSSNDPSVPVLNSSAAVSDNLSDISVSVSTVLSEGMTDLLAEIDADFAASGANQKEIINPYEASPSFNANLFIGQYCASKNKDFESVSIDDMENTLRQNKSELYSYSKTEEEHTYTVTTTVTDPETGDEIDLTTTVTEIWAIYTVIYNGETYFADHVFHLTDEKKSLADDYAQNLSLFLGDGTLQRLPEGLQITPSLGNIRFTDGQTEVVYFNQLDERYADKLYGTDTIGDCGCGPTAMSIIVSSLTGDTVDPVEMAEWSYRNGYWCSGSGSYHALIPAAAKEWGLSVEGCSTAEGQRIADALADGKLIAAIMHKGHFTNSGHFIVLRGVKDEKILVADPASFSRSEKEWELSVILSEASTYAAAGGPFWIIG